jgi:hypothetical protein
MTRTKGSGWGGGPILWQVCPHCGKKKCYYDPAYRVNMGFRCTYCKQRSFGEGLITKTFK